MLGTPVLGAAPPARSRAQCGAPSRALGLGDKGDQSGEDRAGGCSQPGAPSPDLHGARASWGPQGLGTSTCDHGAPRNGRVGELGKGSPGQGQEAAPACTPGTPRPAQPCTWPTREEPLATTPCLPRVPSANEEGSGPSQGCAAGSPLKPAGDNYSSGLPEGSAEKEGGPLPRPGASSLAGECEERPKGDTSPGPQPSRAL